MSFLDRFRSKWDRSTKDQKKPKHVLSKQEQEEAVKKASFRSVPGGVKPAAADKAGKPSEPKRQKKQDTGRAFSNLLRPVVTEKTTRLATMHKYVFEVARSSNKIEIRAAVLALYGVRPTKVNLQNFSGKVVRYGRTTGRTKAWKKAIVTLPAGQKIDVLEA